MRLWTLNGITSSVSNFHAHCSLGKYRLENIIHRLTLNHVHKILCLLAIARGIEKTREITFEKENRQIPYFKISGILGILLIVEGILLIGNE